MWSVLLLGNEDNQTNLPSLATFSQWTTVQKAAVTKTCHWGFEAHKTRQWNNWRRKYQCGRFLCCSLEVLVVDPLTWSQCLYMLEMCHICSQLSSLWYGQIRSQTPWALLFWEWKSPNYSSTVKLSLYLQFCLTYFLAIFSLWQSYKDACRCFH